MKKYKKFIEVKGEKAQELFDCPIVTEIKKATEAAEAGLDVVDMLLGVTIYIEGYRRSIKRGWYIVQDICGHWEVMDGEQWENHKDDVIEETETPDSGSTDSGIEEHPSEDNKEQTPTEGDEEA